MATAAVAWGGRKLTLLMGGGVTGKTVINNLDVVSVPELASINFQPSASPIPAGYQPDSGRIYLASRGYGWADDTLFTGGRTRDRNVVSDQALDTFIFTSTPAKSWRFDVPNGDYQIAVSVGDPSSSQGPQRIVLEGQTAIDGLTTTAGTFKTATKCVQVADGAATVTIGSLFGSTSRATASRSRGGRAGRRPSQGGVIARENVCLVRPADCRRGGVWVQRRLSDGGIGDESSKRFRSHGSSGRISRALRYWSKASSTRPRRSRACPRSR